SWIFKSSRRAGFVSPKATSSSSSLKRFSSTAKAFANSPERADAREPRRLPEADGVVSVVDHAHQGARIRSVVKRRVERGAQSEQCDEPGECAHPARMRLNG